MTFADKPIKPITKIWMTVFSILLFSVIVNILINLYGLSSRLLWSETTPVVVFSLLISILAARFSAHQSNANSTVAILFAVCVLTMLPFLFVANSFGNANLGAIIFTLQANAPQDLFRVGIHDFSDQVTEVILYAIIVVVAPAILLKNVRLFKPLLVILTIVGSIIHPITLGVYEYVAPNQDHSLLNLETDMRTVEVIETPTTSKNIIHIYLESIERTYAQIPSAKNAYSYLNELEQNNLTFTNVGQTYGTDYTAAGMVASQCGVPLVPNGIDDVRTKIWDNTARTFVADAFLPKITCFGDILKSQGYNLSYINGSDLRIFSKGKLFSSHGYDYVFGINSLATPELETRQNIWGLDDGYIFEKAQSEITRLSGLGAPFALTMLTLSTHGPDAFLDASCDKTPVNGSLIPAAIDCTANHIKNLITFLHDRELLQDTVIIIQSDHLAMRNTLVDEIRRFPETSRKNLFTILGSDYSGQYNKAGSAVDIFATILEVLGYRISGSAAYFGRSLISQEQTFVEKLGLERLSAAFSNNRELQQKLWATDKQP